MGKKNKFKPDPKQTAPQQQQQGGAQQAATPIASSSSAPPIASSSSAPPIASSSSAPPIASSSSAAQRQPQPPQGQRRVERAAAGAQSAPLPQPGNIKRGTIGTPGSVGVNYLDVDISKMPDVAYHYDVTITPERPKKFYRKAFEAFRVKYLKKAICAFDGRKSCYAADKLPSASGQVDVLDMHGRSLTYDVTVKETDNSLVQLSSLRSYKKDKIYDKPMRAMQCLEVVLAVPCHERAIRAGRSFFKNAGNGERKDLGEGYEALVGLYQTFVLGDNPYVNVDVSHKSFPIAMTLLEYLQNNEFRGQLNATSSIHNVWNVSNFLKGMQVVYEPPASFGSAPRVYKVYTVSQQPASKLTFPVDNKNITIEAYYRSRNYKIKYPALQCLHVEPHAKNIFLPMELCRIVESQALNRKDGARQVSEMIKFAATSTNERKAKIMDLLKYFNHNADPTISRFGIRIARDFITVSTRLLKAPQLEYKNGKFALPYNGAWRQDNYQFLAPKPKVHTWAILYDDGSHMRYNQVADFERMVHTQAKYVSLLLEPKADIRTFRDERQLDLQFKELKVKKCDLVFVIIPNRGATYDIIKQKAELQVGILTQCIKQNNVERRLSAQLVGNVLLKVNSKLNGLNHKVREDPLTKLSNVMYLGADVTHPSPDQRDIPSVVGVAASHDIYGGAYNMQYRLQLGGGGAALEEIEDMESIVTEHLRIYHKNHNRYPEHILYYRDGVSDGQFLKIKNIEVRNIYNACSKLKFKPKICCVIVVKRHHTRFFPNGTPNPRNKYNNVDPGTIVDRTIVHPNEIQFFLVSHQSIQGTAKPTRYNVIENAGNLDIDLLQQLTYNLCHMFPRCNRSVSYPAPAYLAHLAAARGRVYITGPRLSRSPQEEYLRRLIVPEFMNTNPMYFV